MTLFWVGEFSELEAMRGFIFTERGILSDVQISSRLARRLQAMTLPWLDTGMSGIYSLGKSYEQISYRAPQPSFACRVEVV